jgi:hypothetical protein
MPVGRTDPKWEAKPLVSIKGRCHAEPLFDVVSTAVNAEVSHPLASVVMREAGIDSSSGFSTTTAESLKRGFTV